MHTLSNIFDDSIYQYTKVNAILAIDEDGGMGLDNTLPWPHNSEDMRRFKRMTEFGIVVMGRKTWESLPVRPLKNRINVIITTQNIGSWHDPMTNTEIVSAAGELPVIIDTLMQRYAGKTIWVIGGPEIIYQSAPRLERLHITKIPGQYKCDVSIDLEKLINNKFKLVREEFIDDTYTASTETWDLIK
jgi:dihydrofolate reductase